ncbi:MAG: histidinol dehydrogenase [Gammaproteobacteria bacterium]|nr:histidinol dehydrogenase [Gammaproteobacteria bacterium]
MIRLIRSDGPGFDVALDELLSIPEEDRLDVQETVSRILSEVRKEGDAKLLELTNHFDHRDAASVSEFIIEKPRLEQALNAIDPLVADALRESVSRVRQYHEKQLVATGQDWEFEDELGNRLGQRVLPMSRVGIYAPGGKAAYPSTIVMTAVPAKVAGVEELILCVPMPSGEENNVLLAAACLCEVDLVVSVGGAQAIAAMAYGTETVPRVDKIVGPGNIYVATAKEMVFGKVGIDMIAGPSEVVIIADDTVDPDWIIQDMFAQAEHDELAQAILITTSDSLLEKVSTRLPEMLGKEPRREIIRQSIANRSALIRVGDIDEAFRVANEIAPEHLQLALEDAGGHVDKVRWAGAIFIGADTAEVVGDYTAGPSHVLPTSGTARFASPLGVYDFQTRSSIVACSPEGTVRLNRAAAIIADEEGLSAHAEAARARVKG